VAPATQPFHQSLTECSEAFTPQKVVIADWLLLLLLLLNESNNCLTSINAETLTTMPQTSLPVPD